MHSVKISAMNDIGETNLREKLSAIGTLFLEIALLIFVISMTLLMFGIVSNLVAHFIFGYSWAWEKAHSDDWLLFWVIITTPLMLMGGLVWMVLRDEYQRILERRRRKW